MVEDLLDPYTWRKPRFWESARSAGSFYEPTPVSHSLTWVQGTERACHQSLTRQTLIPMHFCDPATLWQHGSGENSDGLLRQYFPTGTDFDVHSPKHLTKVAAEINRSPREVLGWQSPMEHLARRTSPATEP
jgi:IS30 family transposase